jgi:hypothetical protein
MAQDGFLPSFQFQGYVQQKDLKKRFPDGAVLVEWGKNTGDEVWFLNKLEELAAELACTPPKINNEIMVGFLESFCSTIPME